MNHEGVCRTAPAKPGLLISINKDHERKENNKCKWWNKEVLLGERSVPTITKKGSVRTIVV